MRSNRGNCSTLAKLFAVAAGCTFAVVSFDAGAVPAVPLSLQQPLHVTRIAGCCGLGWHRGPYGGVAGAIGGRLAAVAGSGKRLGGRGASAVGENVLLKFENPAPAGFFV
jgi:hypothetical protein